MGVAKSGFSFFWTTGSIEAIAMSLFAVGLTLLVLSTFQYNGKAATVPVLNLNSANVPVVKFEKKWKTQLKDLPMGYSSTTMEVNNNTLYVVNGGDVGNAILKFDLQGNYLGEYPGWYNCP